MVLCLAAPVLSHAQPVAPQAKDQASPAAMFALAPILNEVGESRTRTWLSSVNLQCEASKPKEASGLCRQIGRLSLTDNWADIAQKLDDTLALKCGARGLMTAYYEPVLQGTLTRVTPQQVALYALPDGAAKALQAKQTWFSRGEIEHLTNLQQPDLLLKLVPDLVPIAWIDDPVEAFFLQIQGSGRIQLRDQPGSIPIRVGFAGHNGHSYRAIGATLVSLGEMQREEVSANAIKAWLQQRLRGNPQARLQAMEVMHSNPRYVFFKRMPDPESTLASGPVGALNVPLTAMGSVAADPIYHPLGSGLLVFTERLGAQWVQVQDVGGGIKGPGRLDLFTGTGEAAGTLASDFKEPLRTLEIVLLNRSNDPKPRLQLDAASALANCSGGM